MARSFETGTLLSKLGFDDPDRKGDLHDIACGYMAQEKFSQAILAASYFNDRRKTESFSMNNKPWRTCLSERSYAGIVNAEFERHITKGSDQYKTTIGFCDMILWYQHSEKTKCHYFEDNSDRESENPILVGVPVEVKISKCSIGDAIRQIRLYREYMDLKRDDNACPSREYAWWVLATHFEITDDEAKQLFASKIGHVRLGEGLNAYADEVRGKKHDGRVL